jgi:hypothetical protein
MKDTAFDFVPKSFYHLCGDHEKSDVNCKEGEGDCEDCPNSAKYKTDNSVMPVIPPSIPRERGTGDTNDNLL